MRNWIKIAILSFFYVAVGLSQDLPQMAKELAPNYAVPDAPAFNILNENPDNILKPSSVKDMGIAFADFLGEDERITLPKAFALEFSPALLINGKNLSLEEYRKVTGCIAYEYHWQQNGRMYQQHLILHWVSGSPPKMNLTCELILNI